MLLNVVCRLSRGLRGNGFVESCAVAWGFFPPKRKGFRLFTSCLTRIPSGNAFLRPGKIVDSRGCSKEATSEEKENSSLNAENNGLENMMNESQFQEIVSENPEYERRLQDIIAEIKFLAGQGLPMPSKIRKFEWMRLLQCENFYQRKKCFLFFAMNERKEEKDKERKARKVEESRQRLLQVDNNHLKYGIGHMGMFIRIYETAMARLLNHRLLGALQYSQNVVFDCSYDNFMSLTNQHLCATQLFYCFFMNRNHPFPFHIKLCNLDKDSVVFTNLKKTIPDLGEDHFPWDVHEESYMDLFPKEKILYLSPHARDTLQSYSHDDVYIIGAFVDKGSGVKASLAKANENGVRIAKLPLDHYLTWKSGGKSLPLNTVLNILLDRRYYNDWKAALQNIPQRFLTG